MNKQPKNKYIPTRLAEKKKANPLTRLMDSPWPRDKKHLPHRIAWLFLLTALVLAAVQIGALYMTGAGAVEGLFGAYFREPQVILVNFAPVVLLAGALFALTGQAAIAAGVPAILLTVLTIANQIKIGLRGEPLLVTDLAFAGEVGNIAGNYTIRFTTGQIVMIVLVLLAIAALVLLTWKMRPRGWWVVRIPAAILLLAGIGGMIWGFYSDNDRYDRFYAGDDLISVRSSVQWYASHGPLYAFLHAGFESSPENLFTEEEMQIIVDKYTQPDPVTPEGQEETVVGIPEDKQVNILMFQMEAYCDLSEVMDIDALDEFYTPLHEIEAQSVSGSLICNVIGGGTITTERAIISGYTHMTEFPEYTNSYAWYLMSQGYTVEGSHPGYAWYYERDEVNAHLGFERYLYSENYYSRYVAPTMAPYVSDAILFEQAVDLLEESEAPYFSLNICYQNHGPYEMSFPKGTQYVTAEDCPEYGPRNILNNYLYQLSSTHEAMLEMIDRLEGMDEPVLLVMFGDHKPYLGSYGSCPDSFEALGINMDVSTDEGFYNTYSTPYFIWANSAAKEVLDNDFVGDGGDFSPCFLMNKIFDLCGWGGDALMQASNDLMEQLDVVHTAANVYGYQGTLLDTLTETQQAALDQFLYFQEYWQKNFLYQDLADEVGEQPTYASPAPKATTPAETSAPATSTVPPSDSPEPSVPVTSVPETSPPATFTPETSPSVTTSPETVSPETTAPETTVPETTAPVPETTPPETQSQEPREGST